MITKLVLLSHQHTQNKLAVRSYIKFWMTMQPQYVNYGNGTGYERGTNQHITKGLGADTLVTLQNCIAQPVMVASQYITAWPCTAQHSTQPYLHGCAACP